MASPYEGGASHPSGSQAQSHWRESGPGGPPSTRSWDRAHSSEGVMKAWFPRHFQPHWEASHHSQLRKNLKPRVGWGALTSARHKFWSTRECLLERAEKERRSLLVLKIKVPRCFPLGGGREDRVCISQVRVICFILERVGTSLQGVARDRACGSVSLPWDNRQKRRFVAWELKGGGGQRWRAGGGGAQVQHNEN